MPLPLLAVGGAVLSTAGRVAAGSAIRAGARYIPKMAQRLGSVLKGSPKTTSTATRSKGMTPSRLAKIAKKGASIGAIAQGATIDLDPSEYSVVDTETRGALENPEVKYQGPSITNVTAANRYAMLMQAAGAEKQVMAMPQKQMLPNVTSAGGEKQVMAMPQKQMLPNVTSTSTSFSNPAGGEKQVMAMPQKQMLPNVTSAGTSFSNPADDSNDALGKLLSDKKSEREFVEKVVKIIEQYLAENGGSNGKPISPNRKDPKKRPGAISNLKKAGMIGAGVLAVGAGNAIKGAIGSAAGSVIGGALSGAGAGATLGTAVLPGIGTAVGAVAGGIAGAVGGGMDFSKITASKDAIDTSKDVGSLSAKYESGGRGSAAVGFDSTGGTSYGKYQIATRTGTLAKFMNYVQSKSPEVYKRLKAAGNPDAGKNGAFAKEWKALAAEGKLGDLEHEFIKITHFDVGTSKLKNKGLKEKIEGSRALQEVMWSTSVQHGGGGAAKIFEKAYKEGMSNEDYIKAIYAERSTRFGSSTAEVRQSVMNRFKEEAAKALALAKTEDQTVKKVAKSAGRPNITSAMSSTYKKMEDIKSDKFATKMASKTPATQSQQMNNKTSSPPKKQSPQPARSPSPSIQKALATDR